MYKTRLSFILVIAKVNDNLFTILMYFSNLASAEHLLKTRWGLLRVVVQSDRIYSMAFDNQKRQETTIDESFRVAFMQWLKHFQDMSSDEKWDCLCPQGTDFQKSVWRALLDIPASSTSSYKKIAILLGKPTASRAVGSAVGANPIVLLIPCHRVVPLSGGTGNYRWGPALKQELLKAESASGTSLHQLFQ